MKKFKFIALLLCFALIATMAIGCSGGNGESASGEGGGDQQFLTLATGGTAGAYYPIGGAMATVISNNNEGVNATAQSTGASVENATLIQKSESDLALLQNDIAYYAANATVIETFETEGSYDNLKGLSVLYPETIQVVAAKDSGIASIADLAGKDVAIGAPGSGTEANAQQILDAYGLTFDDLGKADNLSFAEASEGIQNGQLDAAFVTAAAPNAAISEVAQVSDIIIVPIEADKVQALKDNGYTFYVEQTIPAGTYKGQDAEVNTTAVMAMLAVRGDLDEDLVYNITKSIFENLETIGNSHEKGKEITLEGAVEGMPIDLHPGAQKYFEEQGIK